MILLFVFVGSVALRLLSVIAGVRMFPFWVEVALFVLLAVFGFFYAWGACETFLYHLVGVPITALVIAWDALAFFGVYAVPVDPAFWRDTSEYRFTAARVLETRKGPVRKVIVSGWATKPCPWCFDWKTVKDETVGEKFNLGTSESPFIVKATYRIAIVNSQKKMEELFLAESEPQEGLERDAEGVVWACLMRLKKSSKQLIGLSQVECPTAPLAYFSVGTVRIKSVTF
jgi:hypothetical protein